MAIEETTRLGLPTYTSGSDFHPQRSDFNQRMQLLDELAAIVEQGAHADRPLPETMGRLWMSTDTEDLYYDTGAEWIKVVRIGSGGAGEDVVVDGTASEGTSNRAARADHTHNLPLATGTADGAMSAGDKDFLDSATYAAEKGTLVRRTTSGGNFLVTTSEGTGYVINQPAMNAAIDDATSNVVRAQMTTDGTHLDNIVDFGDYYTSSSSNVTTANGYPIDGYRGVLTVRPASSYGTGWVFQVWWEAPTGRTWSRTLTDTWTSWVELATTAEATASDAGLMPAGDKDVLDSATYGADPLTLMKRTSGGNASVTTDAGTGAIVNEPQLIAYTQDKIVDHGGLGDRHLDNVTAPGWYHQASSVTADASLGYPSPAIAGILTVRRLAGGNDWFVQTYTSRTGGTMWSRAYDGSWTEWVEYATTSTATSSDDGLMSAADKEKLDDATPWGRWGDLMMRDDRGGAQVTNVASEDESITNRAYVDAATSASAVVVFHSDLTSSDHLDNVTTPGEYMVQDDGTVSPDNGYPYNDFGGHLSVRAAGFRVFQEFTSYRNTPRKWMRVHVNSINSWGDWVEFTTA